MSLEQDIEAIVDRSIRRALDQHLSQVRSELAAALTPVARRELLTVREACAQLGVGRGWLQRRLGDGSLKRYGSGRIRVRPADVLALLEREATQSPSPVDLDRLADRLVNGDAR